MSDSDSDSNSNSSDSLLIIRKTKAPSNTMRHARSYSRKTLLVLSNSDKVRCPAGLKPLGEWYGEYEPPQAVSSSNNNNSQTNGQRHGANRDRGDREQGGARARGGQDREKERERDGKDQRYERNDSRNNGTNGATPVTGAMGDFRLAGSRPALNMRDSDDKRRPSNGRENDSRDAAGGERRPWSSSAAAGSAVTDAGARRNPGGDFVKKDGRAAEEGGWRSSKENSGSYRDNRPGTNNDRDRRTMGDRNDRNDRDRGDRRRQPAWMDGDDSSNAFASSPGASSGFANRRLPGRESGGQSFQDTPPWMASDSDNGAGGMDGGLQDSLEGLEDTSPSAKKEQHVDSIQAWKAEMRELERKQKLKAEKELRREMGLPDLDDKDLQSKMDAREGKVEQTQQQDIPVPEAKPAPAKSVFADFLLSGPSSAAKETEAPSEGSSITKGRADDKPRSSRFARFFDAQGNQTFGPPNSTSQAKSPQPAYQDATSVPAASEPDRSAGQSQTSFPQGQDLLAALLPGAVSSKGASMSPKPAPSQADTQSMMRLMEMLHMSSTSSGPSNPPSSQASPQPPPPPQFQHNSQRQQPPPQQPPHLSQHNVAAPPQPRSTSIGRVSPSQRLPPHQNTAFEAPRQGPPHSPPLSTANALQAMFAQAAPQPQAGLPSRAAQPLQFSQGVSRPHTEASGMPQGLPPQSRMADRVSSGAGIGAGLAPPQAQQAQSRRGFAVSPQAQPQIQPQPTHLSGIGSPLPPQQGHPSHAQQLLHLQQQQQQLRSPPPPMPVNHNPNISEQQQAQMAAFLAAQMGAGRLPPGMPAQQAHHHQQAQAFQPPQAPQHAQHPSHQQYPASHGRNPSGNMDSTVLARQNQLDLLRDEQYRLAQMQEQRRQQQQQQQQQAQYFQSTQSPPPPNQFAQQNALAQFLAQSGNPTHGGPASHPLPPPSSHQQQHHPGAGYGQAMQQGQYGQQPAQQMQMQQNQIDLMALLTGATRR